MLDVIRHYELAAKLPCCGGLLSIVITKHLLVESSHRTTDDHGHRIRGVSEEFDHSSLSSCFFSSSFMYNSFSQNFLLFSQASMKASTTDSQPLRDDGYYSSSTLPLYEFVSEVSFHPAKARA
jgi:hypothetical protein